MSKYWKTTTLGLLAASLIFSQAAFANGNADAKGKTKAEADTTATADQTISADEDTTLETSTDTNVEATALVDKLGKIKAKYEQFVDQEGTISSQEGKLGSIQNRVDALKAQLEELVAVEKDVEDLEGTEAEAAVDSLTKLYADLGEFEKALHVQQEYVQKLNDSSDDVLLKEYKEIGKLLKKMGKVGVKALVNGVEPEMDVPPVIENGRTLVPFRALSEALDAEVKWDAEARTVTVTKDGAEVVLTIDSMVATVDGKEYKLDVPAKIIKGRTVVPLRFLSQGLKAKVLWEQETQTAIVIDEEEATATEAEATTTESTTTESTATESTATDATAETTTDATADATATDATAETAETAETATDATADVTTTTTN